MLVAVTLVLSMATPAAAAVRRIYEGETTQGEAITLKTAQYANRRVVLTSFNLKTVVTCEDATTHDTEWGLRYPGGGPVLANGTTLEVHEENTAFAIHLVGEVRRRVGSGSLRVTVADLTDDEQGQVCTTGALTWDVRRI
jgi:hypothetical protein